MDDHKRDMGDFNSLDDFSAGGARARKIKGKISSLARHERYLARSVKTIGTRYAEIIDEMRNNRLEKVGTLNKLKSHIVEPLEAVEVARTNGGVAHRYDLYLRLSPQELSDLLGDDDGWLVVRVRGIGQGQYPVTLSGGRYVGEAKHS